MSQMQFRIKNFSVKYNNKPAINGLTLDIAKNQILSVIGPANSGITTLLRSLNRMVELKHEAKCAGEIYMESQNIFGPAVSVNELRRKVGMVFDVPTALPMSIFDNIAYGPRLNGTKNKKKLNEIVEKSLTESALWKETKDRLHEPAMSLSGGQQQRLCIARVLALEPEVILLDRPCSGLDPISTAKIEESLLQLKKRLTVVIAPHNVQQGVRIADRGAFMLMGRLVEEGTEIFTSPKDQSTHDYVTGRFG